MAAFYDWAAGEVLGDQHRTVHNELGYIKRGTGSPEGVETADVGSIFIRSDGGASTTLYIKESGTGNTGWVAYGSVGSIDHGALTGLSDDDHPQYATNTEFDDHSARHENGGADEISLAGLDGDPTAVTALRGVDYLVGTATGELSAEIAVGTTPGGELGGTWASPTVDATHSGSTHSAATDTHIADTSDAHDASAISILDAANDFTATDVEGALAEIQSDNEAHVAAADPHTGYMLESLIDAAGDLIVGSADNTPARLAIGTDDKFLRSDGTTAAWEAIPFSISFVMSNNGSAIPTGIFPVWVAAFPCTVTAVKAYVDTGTTTVVNAGTGTPPENSDEDFCSSDITIDPADAVESGTVNQNQAVAAGEIVSVEVKTAGTATQLLVQIDFTRP